jgi:spermidine/putrescine transport system substrate-binding protein
LNLLGKDPNSTKKADLDAVKAFFIAHKDVIARFHAADGQFDVAKGALDAISDWNGDFNQILIDPANAKANLSFVLPKEGTVRWVDNLAIPKGAPNPSLAMTFINYLYDPQVAADISNSIGYATPNQAALDQGLISKEDQANPALYAPNSVKQFTLIDLGDAQTLYDTTWADIKAAVSQ